MKTSDSSLTIAISATKAFSNRKTGVEAYTENIIKSILEIDQKNQYILYINPNEVKIHKSQPYSFESVKKDNLIIKKLNWPFNFGWAQARLSLEMIKNHQNILFIPAHILPLYHPEKTIVTIHDIAFKQFPYIYSLKELYLQKIGIKRALKKAWKIIVPSEFTKTEIKKYYPKSCEDKIYVVPHGYNKEIFCLSNQVSSKPDLVKSNLVYIGRLERKKNVANLIKAFSILKDNIPVSQLPNIKLLLIGYPGFGYSEIKQEINDSKYKNDILELGWLNSNKISNSLRNALCFIFPSLYEGFGLPLLEAMACACPIVCSNIGVFREIGENAVLYFDPFDINNMAQTIEQVIIDKELQRDMKQKGLELIKKYDWHKTAENTIKLFAE